MIYSPLGCLRWHRIIVLLQVLLTVDEALLSNQTKLDIALIKLFNIIPV